MTEKNYDEYRKNFSDSGFWEKLTILPRTLGRTTLTRILILYCLLMDKATPGWAKIAIVGVLGYLIMPFDAIPDAIPILGYTDDIAAITLLLNQLQEYVTTEIRQRAEGLLPGRFRE